MPVILALSTAPRRPTSDNEDDPLEAAIRANPCYVEYKALEDCLFKEDRNFARCQETIKALRECSLAKQVKGKTP